jgi:hypothetical protein
MNDTHPEAERVLIETLRAAGPRGRAQMLSMMINDAMWRSQRAIARSHPEMSEEERRLLFIEVHYGRDLAERVRRFLAERAHVAA